MNVEIEREESLQDIHACTHTHTYIPTYASCSYLEDVKMLEILKHLALKPTGNEDGWEKPYFGSLSGFMLPPQHCVLFNMVVFLFAKL